MTPKFRALDKTNNEMISWHRLLNGHNLRNVFMRPEMCGLTLMQSTGLKGKNGVEIYEGDIVRGIQHLSNNVNTPTQIIGTVKYSERNTMFYLENGESHDKFLYSLGSSIYEYEVIGNIYENPNLLEGE